MNNIDKYISLFQKVEDGLPKEDSFYTCLINVSNFFEVKLLRYSKSSGFDKKYKVYSWLNMDRLTTKEKAIDLALKSFTAGRNFERSDGLTSLPIEFIEENKKELL